MTTAPKPPPLLPLTREVAEEVCRIAGRDPNEELNTDGASWPLWEEVLHRLDGYASPSPAPAPDTRPCDFCGKPVSVTRYLRDGCCKTCPEPAAPAPDVPPPLDMLLFCPACGMQHVDAPEPGTDWTNPPHKSHKCHQCGMVWRPAQFATNGVAEIGPAGKADTWVPSMGAVGVDLMSEAIKLMGVHMRHSPGPDGNAWPDDEWTQEAEKLCVRISAARRAASGRAVVVPAPDHEKQKPFRGEKDPCVSDGDSHRAGEPK